MQSAVADSVFLEMGRRDGLYCCSAYLDKHMLDERADEFSNDSNDRIGRARRDLASRRIANSFNR